MSQIVEGYIRREVDGTKTAVAVFDDGHIEERKVLEPTSKQFKINKRK